MTKAPTKAQLLALQRAEMGRCRSLTEKATECTHWATERVNDTPYCSQHAAMIYLATKERELAESALRVRNEQIDAYIAWTAEHPSVHDRMPRAAS